MYLSDCPGRRGRRKMEIASEKGRLEESRVEK